MRVQQELDETKIILVGPLYVRPRRPIDLGPREFIAQDNRVCPPTGGKTRQPRRPFKCAECTEQDVLQDGQKGAPLHTVHFASSFPPSAPIVEPMTDNPMFNSKIPAASSCELLRLVPLCTLSLSSYLKPEPVSLPQCLLLGIYQYILRTVSERIFSVYFSLLNKLEPVKAQGTTGGRHDKELQPCGYGVCSLSLYRAGSGTVSFGCPFGPAALGFSRPSSSANAL